MRQGVKLQFARSLRSRMTEAERMLWAQLRRRQLLGHRFRRQAPIGPYIVDFLCPESRLVIEVDGSQHGQSDLDSTRDELLRATGYHPLRFWNNDVLQRMGGVLEEILNVLAAMPRNPTARIRRSPCAPAASPLLPFASAASPLSLPPFPQPPDGGIDLPPQAGEGIVPNIVEKAHSSDSRERK